MLNSRFVAVVFVVMTLSACGQDITGPKDEPKRPTPKIAFVQQGEVITGYMYNFKVHVEESNYDSTVVPGYFAPSEELPADFTTFHWAPYKNQPMCAPKYQQPGGLCLSGDIGASFFSRDDYKLDLLAPLELEGAQIGFAGNFLWLTIETRATVKRVDMVLVN